MIDAFKRVNLKRNKLNLLFKGFLNHVHVFYSGKVIWRKILDDSVIKLFVFCGSGSSVEMLSDNGAI